MQYPCTRAMMTNVTTIRPDQTVEEALTIFKEKNIRNIPVVDADGQFAGMFGLHQVILSVLPKSVTMQDGLESLTFVVDAAPGIAKRLAKIHPMKISEVMSTDVEVAHCETPTIEALRIIATKGSPVAVLERGTNKFKGMISRKTLLDDMYSILENIDAADGDDD